MWDEFSENIAKNGKYIAPTDKDDNKKYVPYESVYSHFKKGDLTDQGFIGHMDARKKYNPSEGVVGNASFADFVKE